MKLAVKSGIYFVHQNFHWTGSKISQFGPLLQFYYSWLSIQTICKWSVTSPLLFLLWNNAVWFTGWCESMDDVSGERWQRRTLPPHGVANMSLPHTKDTMQRRASAVCKLQNTSAVMTTVNTETFEPLNMVRYVLHDGGWREMESLLQWRQNASQWKKLVCVHQRLLVLTLTLKFTINPVTPSPFSNQMSSPS